MKILGIDPSTYTGMVQLETGNDDESIRKVLLNFPELRGYRRLQSIAKSVASVLDDWQPDVAFIEAYGLANKFTLVEMVEIGTLIRMELLHRGIFWYNCTPKTLKKFTAGNGNAKKPEMATAVEQRWGFKSKHDDVIDAYALAKLGQHFIAGGLDFTFKGVEPWNSTLTKGTSSKRSPSSQPKKVCAK